MNAAERELYEEAILFQTRFLRKPSKIERFSKGVQQQVNRRIPARFHQVITSAVNSFSVIDEQLSLVERNELAKDKVKY